MHRLCSTSVLLIAYFFYLEIFCLLKHIIIWFRACQLMKVILYELPALTTKINIIHVRYDRSVDRCRVLLLCSAHALLTLLFLLYHVLKKLIHLLYHLIYDRLCVLSLLLLYFVFLFYFFYNSIDCCVY